ncbi:MAG: Yip1 family protein, partial [Caldilinea sp.]
IRQRRCRLSRPAGRPCQRRHQREPDPAADGTVAALEELVGNHGGLGGEQTDAFVFHPADMAVTETRNATDVFHILNNHRGKPVAPKPVHKDDQIADWAPGNLAKGIGQVGKWSGLALRAMTLQREAYAEIVRDPLMTGPALLIGVATVALSTLVRTGGFDGMRLLAAIGLWFLAVALVFAAGWVLTRRGAFTQTFRALGFAQSIYLLSVFALYRPAEAIVQTAIFALGFLAVWIGAAAAHKTTGWRTLVLPVVVLLVSVLGSAVISLLLSGAQFTFESLMIEFGIRQP